MNTNEHEWKRTFLYSRAFAFIRGREGTKGKGKIGYEPKAIGREWTRMNANGKGPSYIRVHSRLFAAAKGFCEPKRIAAAPAPGCQKPPKAKGRLGTDEHDEQEWKNNCFYSCLFVFIRG